MALLRMRFTYTAAAFLVLAATWLVWSGHTDPLLLGFGAASCALVVALMLRMRILDEESQFYIFGGRALGYAPWLLWQIVKANVAVARLILAPTLRLSPKLIRVRPDQRTSVAKVIYANSITLTPGTVSLDIRGHQLLVHALTEDAAYELVQGEMNRRVCRLEGPAPEGDAESRR